MTVHRVVRGLAHRLLRHLTKEETMSRILSRILLISGDLMGGDASLRRKILRFTGSRRATRAILSRIEVARQHGPLMGCMIEFVPARGDAGRSDETGWLLRVSHATPGGTGGSYA
jgi:hypothetical protein